MSLDIAYIAYIFLVINSYNLYQLSINYKNISKFFNKNYMLYLIVACFINKSKIFFFFSKIAVLGFICFYKLIVLV